MWTFFFLLAFSGYGNQTPSTTGGKIFCIFYAVIGIPLCLVYLGLLGTNVNNRSLRMVKRLTNNRAAKEINLAIVLTIGVILYTIFPSMIFYFIEDWSFMTCLYYCIVTLSTVGFGDYVAGKVPRGVNTTEILILCKRHMREILLARKRNPIFVQACLKEKVPGNIKIQQK